ncbi:MAG: ribulose-phosphate 3-epimerase [Candidatus Firestonebacteria bacterium]
MSILVSPSLMCADLLNLGCELKSLKKAGVDMFHIDVIDGHFANNFAFGEDIVKAVRKATDLPLDIHLMVYNPEKYVKRFIDAGANIITIHLEACKNDIHSVIRLIKNDGAKVSLAINPETPIRDFENIFGQISILNVMGVPPGFAGCKLSPGIIKKIKNVRKLITKKKLDLDIQIDGGVNNETVSQLVNAGVNILIVGRQILFKHSSNQYKRIINFFKKMI